MFVFLNRLPLGIMILNPVGVPQGEDQVGELVPLEFGDKLLILLVGELAGVVFKYSFSSFPTRYVEEYDRSDIISIGFGDAGYLLGQNPHGDAVVSGAEAKIDQLSRATLNIFRRGAVIEYEQGVGSREEEAGHPQMCGSRSTKPLYVLFLTKVGQRSTM